MIERLCDTLRRQGWTVEKQDGALAGVPPCVAERYGRLPAEWLEFLCAVRRCINADQTAWLLCADDYGEQEDDAFRWNEFELMSLRAAEDEGDAEARRAVQAFWDGHLPVACSVAGEYEYYAIRTADGCVVHGVGPLFEEAGEAAPSFREFAERLASGACRL